MFTWTCNIRLLVFWFAISISHSFTQAYVIPIQWQPILLCFMFASSNLFKLIFRILIQLYFCIFVFLYLCIFAFEHLNTWTFEHLNIWTHSYIHRHCVKMSYQFYFQAFFSNKTLINKTKIDYQLQYSLDWWN